MPTLEETVRYRVPEGTQPGTVFTLRGKGIPHVNDRQGRRGDLIITVNVEIPRGLSDKQKDALREFAEACGEKNYAKKGKFTKNFKKKEK